MKNLLILLLSFLSFISFSQNQKISDRPLAGSITGTEKIPIGVAGDLATNANQIRGLGPLGTAGGDLSGTYPNPLLQTVNSNVGSFGSSTSIPTFTVDGKGRITVASGNVVIAPAGTLSGTTLNSTVVTSSITTLGSDAVLPGNPTTTTQLPNDNSTKIATTAYVDAISAKPIILPGKTINYYGDSFSQAQQATHPSKGFVSIVTNNLGATTNNLSASGRGWYLATTSSYTSVSVNNTNLSICEVGFNDYRRGGSAAKTLEKVKSCARALIVNNFLATAVAANNGSVTAAGTWTTTSGIGDKASSSLSGLVRQSSVSGSTLSYTFSGTTLVIGTFSTDQSTTVTGDFTYAIDGGSAVNFSGKNKTDGISDGVNNNSLVPNAIIVTGLSSGSHTVVVTTTENVATRIDYFGTMNAIASCPNIIITSAPRMLSAGYAIVPSSGSDAAFTAGNSALQSVVGEFTNYPVKYIDLDPFYNPNTDIGTDNIHPNDLGYSHIGAGLLNSLNVGLSSKSNFLNPILISGTLNGSFFGIFSDLSVFSTNRDPVTGTFINTSKSAAQYSITGAATDGSHQWYTASANNTGPSQTMSLNKSGSLYVGGSATATSTLQSAGSFSTGYVAKTANYTATISDETIECTANTFQVTLPTAASITGRQYTIVNSGAGTITIGTTSSQTFVNVTATPTTLTMATVGTRVVKSNGANWMLISSL